jgi:hypothetical protein
MMPPPAGGAAPAPAAPAEPTAAPADAPGGSGSTETTTSDPQQPGTDASSDNEAAGGESYPGQASLRYQLLRHVERDAIGIQYNYFSDGSRKIRPLPLPEEQVESIRMAFAEPDGWADVRTAFAKRRVLILRGQAGCGKKGAAIRLLLSMQQGHIYQLDSGIPLNRLTDVLTPDSETWGLLGPEPGLIIDQPKDVRASCADLLQGFEALLAQANARLVLTAGADVILPDQGLRDYGYILDLPGPPTIELLIARHLGHRLGGELADELLALPGIREIIEKYTVPETSCMFAAALAAIIANRCPNADDWGAAVQQISDDIERHLAGHLDSWFASLPDAQSRAFAIALAVFGGLPYEYVAKAARALYLRFDDAPPYLTISAKLWYPGSAPRINEVTPVITTRRERLQRLGAQVKEIEASGMFGASKAESVEYRDLSYANEVLRYAWTSYEIQDILLDWLKALADDTTVQIQLLTARALGLLATWSFDYISAQVLAPWAVSRNRNRREVVAYALWKAVSEKPALLANVRALVNGWYANRSVPYAQATAARAYGLAFGSTDLASTLEALNRLLIVDNGTVAVAIGNAMADLMAPATLDGSVEPLPAEEADLVRRVLASFEVSIRDRDRSGKAELAFLTLVNLLLTPVPSSATGEILSWPSLLRLLIRMPDIRDSVVTLWRHVLNNSLFPDIAESIMTQWATTAEYDPVAREVFLRLARAICHGHRRCGLIMGRFAAEWVSPRNLTPLYTVSASLQSVIVADGEVN